MKCKCLLFLLLFCSTTFAQIIKSDTLPIEFPYKNYTILDGLSSNETYHTLIDSKGYIWISSDKGVSRFDGYGFMNFTTNDGLIDNTIFNIFEDGRGRVWFIGSNRKLCYYDWKRNRFYSYKYNYVILAVKNEYNFLNFIEEANNKNIKDFRIFNNSEKYEISSENAIIKKLKQFRVLRFSISENNVASLELFNRKILIDKKGNVREVLNDVDNFETFEKEKDELVKSLALDSIDVNNVVVQKNYTSITSKSNGFYLKLNEDFSPITNIRKDHLNTIGIYKIEDTLFFDSENKYFNIKETPNKHFVLDEREKNLLGVYSPKWKDINDQKFYSGVQFSYFNVKDFKINSSSITVKNETKYFVHDNYLEIFKNNTITPLAYNWKMFSSCIYNNKLILGTDNGLAFLSENDSILEYIIPNLDLNNVRIQDLAVNKNSLIIATRVNGIYIVGKNSIKHISKADGIPGDFINHIKLDGDVLWVASNDGACAIKIHKNTIHFEYNIDMSQGVLSPDVRQIYVDGNKIYLGLANGISILDLDKFKAQNEQIPLYLGNIMINDSFLIERTKGAINLEYFQNNIEFNYTGISSTYHNKIKYRYKLNGVNDNWNETYNRSVKYNILPPGNYKFKVQIQNDKKEWQKNTIVVKFKIVAPYWQTLWFKLFLFIIASSLIILLISYFIRKNEQEEKLNLLLNKSEHKALLNQMNPHFIFNSLNSTQNFLLKKDVKNANRYIVKLSNLIRNTFENSKRTFIPLSEELQSIKLYVDLENMRFENKITLQIQIEDNIDVEQVLIPTLLIQPFVENAIHHGILMKSDKSSGIIDISIFSSDAFIKIHIEDNGIGRSASQKLQIGNTLKNKESSGIEITKNRIMLINEIEKMKFEFHITDLYNEDKLASGTRIEFSIPLKLV